MRLTTYTDGHTPREGGILPNRIFQIRLTEELVSRYIYAEPIGDDGIAAYHAVKDPDLWHVIAAARAAGRLDPLSRPDRAQVFSLECARRLGANWIRRGPVEYGSTKWGPASLDEMRRHTRLGAWLSEYIAIQTAPVTIARAA